MLRKLKSTSSNIHRQFNLCLICFFSQELHYIRCVLPNSNRKKGTFEDQLVLNQLNTSSVVAYAEFMKYPARVDLKTVSNFCGSLRNSYPHICKNKDLIATCLFSFGIQQKDFKVGKEFVFIRIKQDEFDQIFKAADTLNNVKKYLLRSYWRTYIIVARLITLQKSNRQMDTATVQLIEPSTSKSSAPGESKGTDKLDKSKTSTSQRNERKVAQFSKSRKSTRQSKRKEDIDEIKSKRTKIDKESSGIRYKNVMHIPQFDPRENSMRCKLEGCNGKTHFYCKTCKIHLCIVKTRNCYEEYHNKKAK